MNQILAPRDVRYPDGGSVHAEPIREVGTSGSVHVEACPDADDFVPKKNELGWNTSWTKDELEVFKGKGIHNSVPVDDVMEYLRSLDPFRDKRVTHDANTDIPHKGVEDFISTLRTAAEAPNSRFKWPSPSIQFEKALAVAVHHLPPNCFVSIENGHTLTSAQAEEKWLDVYHGTSIHTLPNIIEEGFQPGTGAGSDILQEKYGYTRPVPGVYVAKSWMVASTYPINTTTNVKGVGPVSGGSLIALDGTFPLRAIVRCVASHTAVVV